MRIEPLPVKKTLGPRLGPYLATLASVAATFVVVGVIDAWTVLQTALLLYLVPVVLAATRWGRGPAVLAVITSVLGHDLFFVEPVGTLTIARADEAVGLALLLFVAVVTAELADAARRGAKKEQEAMVARRSDELKTALLHAVSHDLRTPLSSIKAAASGLRQGDAAYTDADRAELLAAIEEESDRLDRLVRNLLDASRLEAGALVPHKQPQDLSELVRAVLDRLQPLLSGRDVLLTRSQDLPLVACDYAQIDQVVANLLENAARHTPPGTPVDVALDSRNGAVCVTISDAGPGIPVAERERLFRPFERGRTRGHGSGLGLAIARGLVEAHGGGLAVSDGPRGGATFTFWLPADTETT
jgi:two-component system, OmpR family, sensor histidine kinase KdpD